MRQPEATGSLLERLADEDRARKEAGLWRQRTLVSPKGARMVNAQGRDYLQFASNDYLGLASESVPTTGEGGSGASPLVTGYQPLHARLEQTLCELTGYDAALLFSSGFAANSAPLSLLTRGDLVLADRLSHASILDAALASPATLKRFAHNDMTALAAKLACADSGTLVVSESLFSMDGDTAPMAELVALARAHGAMSWLDDAHGFGVLGQRGLGASEFARPNLLTLTFGKALGAQGAALLGSRALIDSLLQRSRHYVYSTGLGVDQASRVLVQLERLQQGERRKSLFDNLSYFRQRAKQAGIPLIASASPIQPVITGDNHRTLAVAEGLKQHGIWAPAIRPPTVPSGRIRLVINACHTREDLNKLIDALEACL